MQVILPLPPYILDKIRKKGTYTYFNGSASFVLVHSSTFPLALSSNFYRRSLDFNRYAKAMLSWAHAGLRKPIKTATLTCPVFPFFSTGNSAFSFFPLTLGTLGHLGHDYRSFHAGQTWRQRKRQLVASCHIFQTISIMGSVLDRRFRDICVLDGHQTCIIAYYTRDICPML